MSNIWNNSKLCNASLTSVVIAIANIKVKLGLDFDLGTWIKE